MKVSIKNVLIKQMKDKDAELPINGHISSNVKMALS